MSKLDKIMLVCPRMSGMTTQCAVIAGRASENGGVIVNR